MRFVQRSHGRYEHLPMRPPMHPRLYNRRENFHLGSFIQLCVVRESKEEDKYAGDHQRKHPHEIDVEPRSAQYCDAEFFINQNCDGRSH